MFRPFYRKPSTYLKNNIAYRFLLSPGRWRYSYFKENPGDAILKSLSDLDPDNNHVSIFLSEKQIELTNNEQFQNIHLIAFLFAASIRESCQDLCYIDLTNDDLTKLKIKIRCNPKGSPSHFSDYSKYHFEIFLTNKKKKELSKLIFTKISKLPNERLPKIKEKDLKLIKEHFYNTGIVKEFDTSRFNKWALQE
jgi:hypothetical protein